jgi:hypothetical protein
MLGWATEGSALLSNERKQQILHCVQDDTLEEGFFSGLLVPKGIS